MKKSMTILAGLILATAIGAQASQKIVSFDPAFKGGAIEKSINELGGKVTRRFVLVDALVAQFPDNIKDASIYSLPGVTHVDEDRYIKWISEAAAPQLPSMEAVLGMVRSGEGWDAPVFGEIRPAGDPADQEIPWGVKRVNAKAAWDYGAGKGVKVCIVDTGMDYKHPDLAPHYKGGYNEVTNTNDPMDDHGHGTHVSGTIAGRANTTATRPGGSVLAQGLSGVAPGAYLGNYNVFPGNVDNATSLFIAKAVEEAVSDGMDVLNLSLGGGAHKGKDLLEMAVDAAADAGVVVAIAAGNEGPGYYTVGSPGTASNVITVAAITNKHTFAMTLTSAALSQPALATTGTGNGEVKADINGTYGVWADYAGGNTLACTPIAGTPLTGKIALVQRGVCTFATKINNAQAAGAVAVIVYQRDDVAGPPIPMATDGVNIPAVMISRDEGYALRAWSGDRTVTIHSQLAETAVVPNLLADFSSWGPTPNYTLKPDLAAPGVNILSSVVGGGFEVYQGTSMATPHVAGSAALLLAYSRANGLNWGPAEVKAALMGTAHSGANSGTRDPLKVGAGIIDLGRAMNPPALALPSSLSFELVRPVGNQSYAITFTLTNTSGGAQTYTLAEAAGNLTLSAGTVTLSAYESAQITATVANRGAHEEPMQAGTPQKIRGYVTVTSGAGSIRIPYLYIIDYNR